MQAQDSGLFKGTIRNDEYEVYIRMDFDKQDIIVPGQDIYGELPGYLGDNRDSRKWLFTDAKVKGKTARISIINDYGSEDLEATLIYNKVDSTYTLKQGEGSTIKIARNRKWKKLPKTMVFHK